MYDIIKKQNGEKFAQTLRAYHNGIFEIPELDKVLEYAGNDADGIKFFLVGLLREKKGDVITDKNPIELLDEAGYDAYYADTLEKQNAISKYFAKGEELCTFKDKTRFEDYYIINAVKKNVQQIKREDFKNPEREDAYGTSVISIQILKSGGFISIKNRYNHTIDNPDNTFFSNPDNIIKGLSSSLKNYFNVDFASHRIPLPDNYMTLRNQIIQYHTESNGFYFGTNFYVKDSSIYKIDKNSQIMCAPFIIDIKNKKVLNPSGLTDSFPEVLEAEFQNKKLKITKDEQKNYTVCADNVPLLKIDSTGNLLEINLEKTEHIGNNFGTGFRGKSALKKITAKNLTGTGDRFCPKAPVETVDFPKLKSTGNSFLQSSRLKGIYLPEVETVGDNFLSGTAVEKALLPKLKMVGDSFLSTNKATRIHLPELEKTGDNFMLNSNLLRDAKFDKLTSIGAHFLGFNHLEQIHLPLLESVGDSFMSHSSNLKHIRLDNLKKAGDYFLHHTPMKEITLPELETVGRRFMAGALSLKKATLPRLKKAGDSFLYYTKVKEIVLPELETVGQSFMSFCPCLKTVTLKKLKQIDAHFMNKCDKLKILTAPLLKNVGSDFPHHKAMARAKEKETAPSLGEKIQLFFLSKKGRN